MLKEHYDYEIDGQIDFFKNYGIPLDDDDVLIQHTDGVYHGNILEFKLNISNTGSVLFQAIKYLSKLRVKGYSVPARILLIDLNNKKIYEYDSIDYIDDIQKVYIGAASKNNDAFDRNVTPKNTYNYSKMEDSAKVKKLLQNKVDNPTDWYIPIDIDENCILGWAKRYYYEKYHYEKKDASKGDFIGDGEGKNPITGEIRNPRHFKGLINPYKKKTNEKFRYLMGALNDRLSRKELGAFFTPVPYCEKAVELVQKAVDRIPEGNDYIILDRCAGTGNLESALIGKYDKNGDELISHCIVSTYEYYEYKVLAEEIGDLVRYIIPPTEGDIEYEVGHLLNADAMSKEFLDNPLIKQYVDDPNCNIILFENPPFADSSAITYNIDGDYSKRAKTQNAQKYVVQQFKDIILSELNEQRGSARESSNFFIWSGFHYYLQKEADSYIVFSPIKYFKNIHLVQKEMLGGFIFNRKHFIATDNPAPSTISCVLWTNKDKKKQEIWKNLKVFDIDSSGHLCKVKGVNSLDIKKVHNGIAIFNDKRTFEDDEPSHVVCNSKGYPIEGWKHKTKTSIYNKNIIAYVAANGYSPDSKHRYMSRVGYKTGIEQSFGFFLRSDNYLEKLPLWVAKMFPQDNWYDIDFYNNTSDMGEAYTKDKKLLKSCLIYTCLSNDNRCVSFNGPDGRYYRNELCFDDTCGDTLAKNDLDKMQLNQDERNLLSQFYLALNEAKKTEDYDPSITYGVYQINTELNTFHKERQKGVEKTVYDYPTLNHYLTTLRVMLKRYYNNHITDKMFKYELLK